MKALGKHLLAEYYGCDPKAIDDVRLVEASMLEAAKRAGATVIGSSFHVFEPYGVSGVVVISESHLLSVVRQIVTCLRPITTLPVGIHVLISLVMLTSIRDDFTNHYCTQAMFVQRRMAQTTVQWYTRVLLFVY